MTQTSIAVWADRHLEPQLVAEVAKYLEGSGVVDGVLLADQTTNFLPQQLWTSANTPMAQVMDDPDSHSDVWVIAGYLLAHAPSLGLTVSTDAVRHAPAELVQRMLTLANLTAGRAAFHIGGGEAKQCEPFGHKRSQGMSRMEDLFKIFHLLLDADRPVDFEGRRWTFKRAWIGNARLHRPRLYALGGGPQLIDYATTYCDGLAVACPPGWGDAEKFAQEREMVLRQVAAKGRDPKSFSFAVWFPTLLGSDSERLEHYFESPLIKWMTGIFGRVDARQWHQIGLESPVPEDWTYFKDFLPYGTDDGFIDDVLSRVTADHVRQSWLTGTPHSVAAAIEDYSAAGADWVCPMDYMPLVLDPVEAGAALQRSVDVCRLIKTGDSSNAAFASAGSPRADDHGEPVHV